MILLAPPPRGFEASRKPEGSEHGRRADNTELSIIQDIKNCYLLWHSFLIHLPRLSRYTLGAKIDNFFTDILELAQTAKYTKHKEKKIFLETLSHRLDLLKFFVTLLWETKSLDAKKFGQLSGKLDTIGRRLGGWIQSILKPPQQ